MGPAGSEEAEEGGRSASASGAGWDIESGYGAGRGRIGTGSLVGEGDLVGATVKRTADGGGALVVGGEE